MQRFFFTHFLTVLFPFGCILMSLFSMFSCFRVMLKEESSDDEPIIKPSKKRKSSIHSDRLDASKSATSNKEPKKKHKKESKKEPKKKHKKESKKEPKKKHKKESKKKPKKERMLPIYEQNIPSNKEEIRNWLLTKANHEYLVELTLDSHQYIKKYVQ